MREVPTYREYSFTRSPHHSLRGFKPVGLATPVNGRQDFFLTIEVKTGARNQIVGLKAAFYSAEELGVDTDKILVWTQWGF